MNESASLEEVRGYWNCRPCNLRHSPEPSGTEAYFNQVEARKYLVEPHIPGFADFPRWRGKKVLEIGCGMGTDTMNFARAGALVTATDLSVVSLELARKRAKVFGLEDSICFVEANAEKLSHYVQVEEYDLVYSFGVVHHTPHPDRAIAEMRKYLGPQSEMRVMVYHRRSWKVLALALRNLGRFSSLEKLVARHSEAQEGCPVTYTYTRQSIRGLLSGLEVKDVSVQHIFPWKVPAYREYRYEMEPWFRILPRPLFHRLERILGWHLCAVATLP